MDTEDLERALRAAPTYDAWVVILARYFSSQNLCYGHGTDNAADEAFWLLRHLQKWGEEAWEAQPVTALARPAAELAVRRATERIPLAYLIGEAWFAGLKFYVDRRVLVPRSPCAELIERCFEPWCPLEPGDRVLDVGTGSACIAIAVASYCDGVLVDATDASADALEVAAENVARHALGDRVRLHQADLFPSDAETYRVIISNPPYVPEAEIDLLPPEYRYEPRLGLAGGASGLEPAVRLLEAAPNYLDAGGVLVVEVGSQAGALTDAFPGMPLVWLDFERGGEGVFIVTAEQLAHYWRDRPLSAPGAPGPT